MTRLEWIDDQTGYRCPRCKLFVAVPLSKPARDCPRCPNDRPLDERLFDALRDAGFDETDAGNAAAAVLPLVVSS